MSKEWTDDMGEISGFGGEYEAVCRAMTLAAINWIDEHPDAELEVHSFSGVYGLAVADNDPAKQMEAAMMDAPVYFGGKLIQKKAREDCTGAMHHAALSHALAYKRLGWDEYQKQLRERKD